MLQFQQEAVLSWPAASDAVFHIADEDKVLGFAKQRAQLFALGSGEYVSSVDDDDKLNGSLFLQMLEHVAKTKPPFIQSKRVMIDRLGRQAGAFSDVTKACTLREVLAGKATVLQLAIVRRDLALDACNKALAFLSTQDPRFIGAFDLVYYLELLKVTNCQRYPYPVYQWRHHGLGQYNQLVRKELHEVLRIYAKCYS